MRMPKVRPPAGWYATLWELLVVTVGVLLALGAQQLADEHNWSEKVSRLNDALRDEIADHYVWSVAWRVGAPCMIKQIELLQDRVFKSGNTLDPAPIYTDLIPSYVLRMPSREYGRSAYDGGFAEGSTQRLEQPLRRELSRHYAQIDDMRVFTAQNDSSQSELFGLTRRVQLDPIVRYQIMNMLDRLHGRVEVMDQVSSQLIDHIDKMGMTPPAHDTGEKVRNFETYRFCRAKHLPMRSLKVAMAQVTD